MIKWFKERTAQEKWMLALIAMLLVGIAVRWTVLKTEVADAFRDRFSAPTGQVDSLPARQ
jgi:hypothetical protein